MPDDQDLPYLEMLYKFVSGKQSYYDLASTRHVEPQANERMSEEEEETTDRPDRSSWRTQQKYKFYYYEVLLWIYVFFLDAVIIKNFTS